MIWLCHNNNMHYPSPSILKTVFDRLIVSRVLDALWEEGIDISHCVCIITPTEMYGTEEVPKLTVRILRPSWCMSERISVRESYVSSLTKSAFWCNPSAEDCRNNVRSGRMFIGEQNFSSAPSKEYSSHVSMLSHAGAEMQYVDIKPVLFSRWSE